MPESMGAKGKCPLGRREVGWTLPTTPTRAPGADVVTAIPRETLDGEAPQRLLVMVVPRQAPKRCEAGLEVVEEGAARLMNRRRGCTQAEGGCDVGLPELTLFCEGRSELYGSGRAHREGGGQQGDRVGRSGVMSGV